MKEKLLNQLTKDLQKYYGRKLTIDEKSMVWDIKYCRTFGVSNGICELETTSEY